MPSCGTVVHNSASQPQYSPKEGRTGIGNPPQSFLAIDYRPLRQRNNKQP
jgi:hypothetical protein